MEPLQLLEINFKIFRVFGFEFKYDGKFGLFKHCFYLMNMVNAVFQLMISSFYLFYRAKDLAEITDCVSNLFASIAPVFRSICFYVQRKAIIKTIEIMTEISHDRK